MNGLFLLSLFIRCLTKAEKGVKSRQGKGHVLPVFMKVLLYRLGQCSAAMYQRSTIDYLYGAAQYQGHRMEYICISWLNPFGAKPVYIRSYVAWSQCKTLVYTFSMDLMLSGRLVHTPRSPGAQLSRSIRTPIPTAVSRFRPPSPITRYPSSVARYPLFALRSQLSVIYPFSFTRSPFCFPFSVLSFPFSHYPFTVLRHQFPVLRYPLPVFRSP